MSFQNKRRYDYTIQNWSKKNYFRISWTQSVKQIRRVFGDDEGIVLLYLNHVTRKCVFGDFRLGNIQTSLLSYRS